MAITLASTLEGSNDTPGSSSFNTSSLTPTANRLYLLVIAHGLTGGAATVPTASGGGLGTWTLVDSKQRGGTANQRITVLRAMSASPGAAAVVAVSFGGVAQDNYAWRIIGFDGCSTSGTNGSAAVVSTQVSDAEDSGTTHEVTLPFAVTPGNATFGCIVMNTTGAPTPGSGFVQLGTTIDLSGPNNTSAVEWDADGNNPITFGATGTPQSSLIGLELQAAVGGGGGSATIAFRAAASNGVSSNANLTISKPSGVVNDDIMLAFIQCPGRRTIAVVPSGWSLVGRYENTTQQTTGTGTAVSVYWKKAASEGSSYTWSADTGNDDLLGVIVAYSGAHLTSPIYSIASQKDEAGSAVNIIAPAVNVGDNGWLVTCHAFNPNASSTDPPYPFTTPSGMTPRTGSGVFPPAGTWEQCAMSVYDQGPITPAGAAGPKTSTVSGDNGLNVGIALSLSPSGATGGGATQTINLNTGVGGSTPVDGCMAGFAQNSAESIEDLLGKDFPVLRVFDQWNPPGGRIRELVGDGRLVLASHKPPSKKNAAGENVLVPDGWKQIAEGTQDSVLRQIAVDYRTFNKEVVVIFHHEPHDNASDAKSGGTGKVTYIDKSTVVKAKGSSSITIPIPSEFATNDLLLAILNTDYCNISHTPPSGWTLLGWREEGIGTSDANPNNIPPLTGGTDLGGYVFYKKASGSETSVTFSAVNGDDGGRLNLISGTVAVFRGVHLTSPIKQIAWNHQTSGDHIDAPSVDVAAGGALVCAFIEDDEDPLTVPSGMSQIATYQSEPAHPDDYTMIAYQLYSSAATTGVKTSSHPLNSVANDMAISISLKPQPSDSDPPDSGYAGTAQEYKNAWRHFYEVFRDAGCLALHPSEAPATLEPWQKPAGTTGKIYLGYCAVNSWADATISYVKNLHQGKDPLYPGDDIVDVFCHDCYNYGDFRSKGGSWKNPWPPSDPDYDPTLFKSCVDLAASKNKPIIVGECGCHPSNSTYDENPDHDRNDWFRKLATYIKTDTNAKQWFKGFCYFGIKYNNDWRITGTDSYGNTDDGKVGWQDAFVDDSYFVDEPLSLSGLGSSVPGTGSGGIPSGEEWGTPTFALTTPGISGAGGIASAEAWGTPIFSLGGSQAAQSAAAIGIASEEEWGTPNITLSPPANLPKLVLEAKFGSVWVDLSSRIRDDTEVLVQEGRQSPLQRYETSHMTITLDNRDRALEPEYEGSPYYPHITPNVPLRLSAVFSTAQGTGTYRLFIGFADSWMPNWFVDGARDSTVMLEASDGMKILAGMDLPGSPFAREVLKDLGPVPGGRQALWLRMSEDGDSQGVAGFETPVIDRFNGRIFKAKGSPQFNSQSLVFQDRDGAMAFDSVDDMLYSVDNPMITAPPWCVEFWFMFTDVPDLTFEHVFYYQPQNTNPNTPAVMLSLQFGEFEPGSVSALFFLGTTAAGFTRWSDVEYSASAFAPDIPHHVAFWVGSDYIGRIVVDAYELPILSDTNNTHGAGAGYPNWVGPAYIGGTPHTSQGVYGPAGCAMDEFIISTGEPNIQQRIIKHRQAGAPLYLLNLQGNPASDGTIIKQGAWGHHNARERVQAVLETVVTGSLIAGTPLTFLSVNGPDLGPTTLEGNVLQYLQKVEETSRGAFFWSSYFGGQWIFLDNDMLQLIFLPDGTGLITLGNGFYGVNIPNTAGAYVSSPASTEYNLTDFELRWEGSVDDWTTTAGAGNQRYLFSNYGHLVSGFKLYLQTSNTNIWFQHGPSAVSGSAVRPASWINGKRVRIKITRVQSSGLMSIYGSDDLTIDWADLPLLSTFTASPGASTPAGSVPLQIGNGEGATRLAGNVYYAELRTLAGTVLARFDPRQQSRSSTSWTVDTGETWTLQGTAVLLAEHPYTNPVPNNGDDEIINEVEISRVDGPTIYLYDKASRDKHGPRNYSVTDLMFRDDDDVYAYGAAILAKYKEPKMRMDAITLKAINSSDTKNQNLVWQILGRCLLNPIHINVRPPGGGVPKTMKQRIQSRTLKISKGVWECTWGLR